MANKKCCHDKEICEHFKLFVLKLERDHKQASDWLDAFAESGRVSSQHTVCRLLVEEETSEESSEVE
ncbi:hypothetical protein DTO166G4_9093 [Paecilomyces variotii]|nr:hypothetical protein DTO166G4_9093 [Paecilomyces variotii]KAJ9229188.1 hypothetical protein DTO166G5_8039 [Paecilomyces variotii]KAJ9316014.1 hypothetical protein DTO271D3_3590 [Paecilomyces variotii]